ncbi:hypothetical protein AB0M11_08220 [Streptomyces sp. NPDC051987]|uniref:hypothetical protein n=1 Tax=Streptomyces sp. NPDC051987 TaxID=3155808 RepID=UPI0034298A23
MSRLTTLLACCYLLAAGFLLHCGAASYRDGHHLYAGAFAGTAALLGLAVILDACQREERHDLRAELERATRPPATRASAEDGVVAMALAGACCERWWTSAGAEHDPKHCTRKDQTL